MNLQINEIYHGFRLLEEAYIEEISSMARLFLHEKSGANLVQLANEDANKVFTLSFKTPPTDNSGVPHIVEHAVCCASQKYPLKDTFVEMDKGSLNISLNACTYKDMTMYYCASQNAKDLMNLMEVFIDLVFHPLIYSNPYFFKQEGWHYALEDEKEEITYNGIVYNEMKGEYGEPSALLDYEVHKALFPDTLYRYDSGGLPEEIVKLTEKDFLAFHAKHYHPSNSSFYLYGDGDLLKQLALLNDLCLDSFEKREIRLDIPKQEAFTKPQYVKKMYSITKEESDEKRVFMALSFVVGEVMDTQLRLAFQIIEHMLLRSAASPLLEVLVGEKGIGKVLEELGYDSGKRQPTFSIILKGSKKDKESLFEQKVFEVLRKLSEEGIPKDLLEASIAAITFGLLEAESSAEVKGVVYSEEVQMSLLYGEHPFNHLSYQEILEKIVQEAKEGYFEELIQTYFLDNNHRACVVLEPAKGLEEKNERILRKHLKAYKSSLTTQALKQLVQMNKTLDALQEKELTKEELKVLPVLTLEDIERQIVPMVLKETRLEDVPVIFQPEKSHDIVYMHILWDTTSVEQEDIPYIGLLANILTYLSTTKHSYRQLENEINKQTGGLNCSINAYSHSQDTDNFKPYFKLSTKVMMTKIPQLMALLEEIITESLFCEKEKIREILEAIKYEIERSFVNAPEYRATRRVYTYFSAAGVYEDLVSGMAYHHFLDTLSLTFDEQFERLASKLESVYRRIMQKGNMLISLTGEEKNWENLSQALVCFFKKLPNTLYKSANYAFLPSIKNEAYATANSLQTIAKGFNFKKQGYAFKGTLYVISHMLNSGYLWDKVRLQGGAYGCDLTISRDGTMLLCSYCDPGLTETLEIYHKIGDFLRKIDLDEEEWVKYIIGTIGGIDQPLTMEEKSEKALLYHVCSISERMVQQERHEILQTTQKDIRKFADLFESFTKDDEICVIGGKRKLEKNKGLFKEIIYK